MRILLINMAAVILLIASCNKEEQPTLSADDQEAIEGMEASLQEAETYHDSLQMCCEEKITCDDSRSNHFFDQMHHADSAYRHHHDNFSQDDRHRDHSHEDGGHVHSGQMHHQNHHDRAGPMHNMHEHERMHEIMNKEYCFD